MSDKDKNDDGNSRLEAFMLHPLFARNVAIPTPPILDMYALIKRMIVLREPAVTFEGPSGAGKSYGTTVLEAMIKADFPRVCVVVHHAHNQQYASIRAFFKHFLSTVGHKEQRGETFDLRERLVRILVDDARAAGMNLIVLMVDEANAMGMEDFLFLKDVSNDLSMEGVQLITFLLGQSPDLGMVLDNLALEGRLDLLARFGLRRIPIRQCSTAADLRQIFAAIDENEYPARTGITWTAFFVPEAFKAGFRLVQQAENCERALHQILNSPGVKQASFPTRQLFAAIRIFLLNLASTDCQDFTIAPDAWRDAIQEAMIKDAADMANRRPVRERTKKGKS